MLFVYLQFVAAFYVSAIHLNDAKGRLYPITYNYSDNTSHNNIHITFHLSIFFLGAEYNIDNSSADLEFQYDFFTLMQIYYENDVLTKI